MNKENDKNIKKNVDVIVAVSRSSGLKLKF